MPLGDGSGWCMPGRIYIHGGTPPLIPLRRPKSISVYINTRGRSVPDDNDKSKPILTLRLSDHVRPRHEKPGTKTYLADDRIYMMDQDGSEMLWKRIHRSRRAEIERDGVSRDFFINDNDAKVIVEECVDIIVSSVDDFIKKHDS